MNNPMMDVSLRIMIRILEKEWGIRPVCILACQGAADEHWQIWHPADTYPDLTDQEKMWSYCIDTEGTAHKYE